ncbi:unnamed protein product [Penicillium salamii]|uniref:HCP-like protein n=1 Tax=Penicillium salamii TaxID=1612424 RepID=A0A9W4NA29_9EURO|nr:unnamed protein product [Penicillium salamii]CAG8051347.1 unnamed protein product [Penicillium salamii]CAG8331115.1 unnamed protein product [Penicillium salamii]CAG8331425.1 unnamed protein product [Penicillium salamii]CAG8340025.1 unnamed protein product [Penicillium salamii]
MPSLRNILHKREELTEDAPNPPTPEFKLIRSDTNTQEIITPETDNPPDTRSSPRRSFQLFNRSRASSSSPQPQSPRRERRLSNLLHLDSRSRSNSRDSVNLPADLPQIEDDQGASKQEREAEWEKRATVLVQRNPQFGHSEVGLGVEQARSRSSSRSRVVSDPDTDVLYGLALRHGWGCPQDLPRAVTYLSAAASNSAEVEAEALRAGVKKGGSAKGELVLAMFELANCFRNGWGLAKDPAAARQYYETAANLGDTDAMNEVGWCYLEGFGGKKDKFKAAKYYRLAEENGCPTLGNSWYDSLICTMSGSISNKDCRIWKDKYNPS